MKIPSFSYAILQCSKSLSQSLLSGLSAIIFATFDLLDCVLCIVFKHLDDLFEGNAAVSECYCNNKRKESDTYDDQVSETLYGDARRNVFRDMGLLGLWLRIFGHSRVKHEKNGKSKVNRWSDCGCDSCLSWVRSNNEDELSLHVVALGPDMSHLQADNVKDEAKKIENVVFLHGFMSSSSFWTETIFPNISEEIRKTHRLFAVDLLGFGRSPKPHECLYTLQDHLQMIEKSVITPYELKSFHIVAHSMGSIIALALAAKYSEHVKSVTLVASPYFPTSEACSSSLALQKLAGKKLWPPLHFGAAFMSWYEHLGRLVCLIICQNHRIWECILRTLTGKRDLHFIIKDMTMHTHHSAWHSMHNVICGGAKSMDKYLDILRERGVKITVIQGDQDQVVPLECSHKLHLKVPEAEIKVIPKLDHITVVLDRTKEFTEDLEFIWSSAR